MKYTNEQVLEAVSKSDSWAGVHRFLKPGSKKSPGMETHLKKRALALGANIVHFKYGKKKDAKPVAVVAAPEAAPTPQVEVTAKEVKAV